MELSGQRQARPGCFALWDRASGRHSIRGWVGPRAILDASENETHLLPLPEIEPRLLGYPARSTVSISAPDGHSTDSLFSDLLRTSLVFRTNRFRSLPPPPILKIKNKSRSVSILTVRGISPSESPTDRESKYTSNNWQHTPNTVRPMHILFHKTRCIHVMLKLHSEELHSLKSSDISDYVLWPTLIFEQLFLTGDPGRWSAQPLKNIFQYNIQKCWHYIYIYIFIYTLDVSVRMGLNCYSRKSTHCYG